MSPGSESHQADKKSVTGNLFSHSTQGLFTTVEQPCIIKALMNNSDHAFSHTTHSLGRENKSSQCSYQGQGWS